MSLACRLGAGGLVAGPQQRGKDVLIAGLFTISKVAAVTNHCASDQGLGWSVGVDVTCIHRRNETVPGPRPEVWDQRVLLDAGRASADCVFLCLLVV
jgi:hypothetical protein